MINALEELKEVLKEKNKTIDNILAIRVILDKGEYMYDLIKIYTLEDLKDLDYNSGYGAQELHGYILLDDNDWLERHECIDGAEWWEYRRNPHLDDKIIDLEKWLNR